MKTERITLSVTACVAAAFVIAYSLAPATAKTDNGPPLLIAPHISGETFCSASVDNPAVTDEEAAAILCTGKGQNAANRINAVLDQIGPKRSPLGHFELGYTLNLPLMRFFTRSASGAWVIDQPAIDNAVRIIKDVDRPVVVYLSANHFTDGGIALSNELARNPANLMWTRTGPLGAYDYFVVALHAWTLVDLDAPINVMRRRAFSAVLDSLCRLDAGSRARIAAVSVLGEVHQLWGNYGAGQGYDAGFDITDYAPKAVAGFHKFLAQKYGTVSGFNAMAGSNFRSFEDVTPPSKNIRKEKLKNYFEHVDAYASGVVPVQGWAYDPSGKPVTIAVYLDGRFRGEVTANLNRSDVPEALPAVTTPNVGWRYDLDYHAEPVGVHTLEVFAVTPDGRKIRVTRRGLTIVPRDQSPSPTLPALPVEASDPEPHSPVMVDVDGPAPLFPLFYNPIAKDWLEYRNAVVADYIAAFANLAGTSCLPHNVVFSHQLLPELNSSWDPDLMAVNRSQKANASYQQGATLYGGAAWGDAFFDWKAAQGWQTYAVSEMHPRFKLSLAQYDDMFDRHRRAGARFVAPYYLSIAPKRLTEAFKSGLSKLMIDPVNHDLDSDGFYGAISDVMNHH